MFLGYIALGKVGLEKSCLGTVAGYRVRLSNRSYSEYSCDTTFGPIGVLYTLDSPLVLAGANSTRCALADPTKSYWSS